MGQSNSLATFQRLMDMVLRGLTWESVLVYIDDIVVYAQTYEEFIWTEERDTAFKTLKTNLVTAPILAMSQDTGAYTLDVDASNWAA